MGKRIYCAIPPRLVSYQRRIVDVVAAQNCVPIHAFQTPPCESFENRSVGRELSMESRKRMVDISDELWMFGVSDGTLEDLSYALSIEKPIRLNGQFDPSWNEHNLRLRKKHSYALEKYHALSARAAFERKTVSPEYLAEIYAAYNPLPDMEGFVAQALFMFPKLNCGLASVYLQNVIPHSRIHRGTYDGEHHTTLLIEEGTIADITADQYGGPRVYVGAIKAPWG